MPDDIRVSSAIGAYTWLVPGFVLGLPGVLVLVIVALQMGVASLFVPVTRRVLGIRTAAPVRRRRLGNSYGP